MNVYIYMCVCIYVTERVKRARGGFVPETWLRGTSMRENDRIKKVRLLTAADDEKVKRTNEEMTRGIPVKKMVSLRSSFGLD